MSNGSLNVSSTPVRGEPSLPGQAILAVDAGFTATGYAVVKAGRILTCGCFRTKRSNRKHGLRVADDDAERSRAIARELMAICKQHDVRGIIAELPSAGAQNARAATCMARAGTIVVVVSELANLPSEWVPPSAVKAVAGRSDASKLDVERAVQRRWPDAPLPKLKCEREHAADALAAFMAAEHGTLVRLLNGGQ